MVLSVAEGCDGVSFVPPYQESAAVLAALNPVVPKGVLAAETDTGVVKVGDGATRYNSLSTAFSGTYLTQSAAASTYAGSDGARLTLAGSPLATQGGLYNFTPANFKRFRAAVAVMRAGGAAARISMYGDSQSGGYQSATGTDYTRSFGQRAISILNTRWYPSRLGIQFPISATSGLNGNPAFTLGSGWTKFVTGSPPGQGPLNRGSVQAAFNAAGALSLTATSCDTFEVLYPRYSGGATIGAAIDGGSITTISAAGASALLRLAVTTVTPGSHTVTVTCSGGSGTNYVEGIEAYDSTTSQARITLYGGNSAKSSDYAATDLASNPWEGNAVTLTNANGAVPKLVVWTIGTNDHASAVAIATFEANCTTYVQRVLAAGADVILVAPAASGSGSTTTWGDYRDALYRVALANGCGLVDMQARWDAYVTTNASPYSYWADTDHPSNTGYAEMGAAVATAVMMAAP